MLVGLGWSFGKAQTPQPDFELTVDAPVGAGALQDQNFWISRSGPALTEGRRPGNTLVSALTGRHPPAAREHPTCSV